MDFWIIALTVLLFCTLINLPFFLMELRNDKQKKQDCKAAPIQKETPVPEKKPEETEAKNPASSDAMIWELKGDTLYIRGQGTLHRIPADQNFRLRICHVVIEPGVTAIGGNALRWFDHMETVEIPNSVTEIGEEAFYSCMKLKNVVLPEGLQTIGQKAFENCISACITLPEAVQEIGWDAFKRVPEILYHKAPHIILTHGKNRWEALRRYESMHFQYVIGCRDKLFGTYIEPSGGLVDGYKPEISYPDGAVITKYTGTNVDVTIPAQLDGHNVVAIGRDAFSGQSRIYSVTIEAPIVRIGVDAFFNCCDLESVIFPESLELIDSEAFSNTALTELKLPSKLRKIGADAFSQTKLREVILPESLEILGDDAFCECQQLEKVSIPKGIECFVDAQQEAGWPMDLIYEQFGPALDAHGEPASDCGSIHTFAYCPNLKQVEDRYGLNQWQKNMLFEDAPWLAARNEEAGNSPKRREMPMTDTRSGTCGDGLTWHQQGDTLYIQGEGVVFPNSFCEEDSFSKVVIAPGCTGIHEWAFGDCKNLQSVELPETLEWIGHSAFYGCNQLKLQVPNTVTEIQGDAFCQVAELRYNGPAEDPWDEDWAACKRVDHYHYGTGGRWKLEGDTLYIEVEGPMQLVYFGEVDDPDLQEDSFNSPFYYKSRSKIRHAVIAPGCTKILSQSFCNYQLLETVSIPDTVTQIESHAFELCTSLRTVVLPRGLTTIGGNLFYGCEKLAAVSIPDSVTTICNGAFCGCKSLVDVSIPKSVTAIGVSAFEDCCALKNIVVPKGVTKLVKSVFEGCTGLERLVIPDTVTEVGSKALLGVPGSAVHWDTPDSSGICIVDNALIDRRNGVLLQCLEDRAESFVVPQGITRIECSAFLGKKNLESVQLPDSVREIDFFAFFRCTNLRTIRLPEGLNKLATCAFCECSALESVEIPGSVKLIGDKAFADCNGLKRVVIHEGTEKILEGAFRNCRNLSCVVLPESLKEIQDRAFSDCVSLRTVHIPKSVENLSPNAFRSPKRSF